MPKILIHDAATGETVEREISDEEAAAQRPDPASVAARQHEQLRAARRNAFQAEADPLYFAWQRGEGTEQAWLDKCAEIRARYPYIES